MPSRHSLAAALRKPFHLLHLVRWQVGAVADHPGGVWHPAQEGLGDTLSWLRTRWRALAAQAVAARRPHFWEARLGIDWFAVERALATSGLPPARQAAARGGHGGRFGYGGPGLPLEGGLESLPPMWVP